jgi:hypothetical protein
MDTLFLDIAKEGQDGRGSPPLRGGGRGTVGGEAARRKKHFAKRTQILENTSFLQ